MSGNCKCWLKRKYDFLCVLHTLAMRLYKQKPFAFAFYNSLPKAGIQRGIMIDLTTIINERIFLFPTAVEASSW